MVDLYGGKSLTTNLPVTTGNRVHSSVITEPSKLVPIGCMNRLISLIYFSRETNGFRCSRQIIWEDVQLGSTFRAQASVKGSRVYPYIVNSGLISVSRVCSGSFPKFNHVVLWSDPAHIKNYTKMRSLVFEQSQTHVQANAPKNITSLGELTILGK